MTNFTKGPWQAVGLSIHTKRGGSETWVANVKRGRANEVELADARLIAAAPEMYEALKNLENDDGLSMPPSAWKMVQDAIAKAEALE